MHPNAPDINELARRIENLLRPGTIHSVNLGNALCRVRAGALVSGWVPWFAHRAGDIRHWSPPSEGEQCLLLSPGGDTAAGMALVGLYSNSATAPSANAKEVLTQYPDGAAIGYNHESHTLTASLPAGSTANLSATQANITADQVAITAQVTINGSLSVTEGITGAGSLNMARKT